MHTIPPEQSSNIQNVPNSSAGNVNNNADAASILKNLMPGDVLSGIINQIKECTGAYRL